MTSRIDNVWKLVENLCVSRIDSGARTVNTNKNTLYILIAFVFGALAGYSSLAGKINKNGCTYKGKKLYGKVKAVNSFSDIKVQVVNAFPDLKVKKVNSFASRCGEWKFVSSFPDLKVQFVNSFPDIKIKYVNSFPGLP